jgi:hypothetical protein
MKKLMFASALVMAAMAANAQRIAIKTSDLQKSITDIIAKDYQGYVISNADQVVTKKVTTYEVVITKGYNSETLAFDKDGKFKNLIGFKSGIPEKSPGSKSLAHYKPGSGSKAGNDDKPINCKVH